MAGGLQTEDMWRPWIFSRAFDDMAPELSQQALVAAGWPEHLATLQGGVWKAQEHTVGFGGHQHRATLKTTFADLPGRTSGANSVPSTATRRSGMDG